MENVVKDASFLLVEDDEVDVMFIKRLFKKHDILNSLYRAENGIEALEMLRGENGKEKISCPCIMLIDINMPKMDGFEFLQEIRKDSELNNNIVFILTTSFQETDIATAYKLNVAGYFLKNDINKLMDMLSIYKEINKFPS